MFPLCFVGKIRFDNSKLPAYSHLELDLSSPVQFDPYLMAKHDNSLDTIITLKETFLEVMGLSWNPDRLLGIVRSHLILSLHLQRDVLNKTKDSLLKTKYIVLV